MAAGGRVDLLAMTPAELDEYVENSVREPLDVLYAQFIEKGIRGTRAEFNVKMAPIYQQLRERTRQGLEAAHALAERRNVLSTYGD
jgi:hypothetical protein